MRFIIDSSGGLSGSLSLKVAGFSIDVSDISASGRISIVEDLGNVTIEILPVEAVTSLSSVVPEVEPVQEVSPVETAISTDDLFQRLASLRKQISQEVKLPAYMVFHDTTLKDMASKLPADLSEMKDISGVGQAKIEKYGSRFLDAILQFVSESEGLSI
jgi:ATP-dependent DNA helicase RecQ